MSFTKDRYTLLTNLFFIGMAVFAIVFAGERFQADGAYYLFKVVNTESFHVEHQRYILAASQALPLLGAKMGLSLDTIFILNSLSNVVFFYLVFCYTVYYLRDRTGGVAVILFMTLGVLHIQFTPMYEIWYGAMLLVPLRSHLACGRYFMFRDLLFLGILMATILFSHPLLFVPLIFILMFDALDKMVMMWRLFFVVVIVFVVWYLMKKLFLSEYEAGKVSMLDTSWNKAYLNLLDPSYYWKLIKFFFTWYTVPVLTFLVTIVFYIVRRAYAKALLLSVFFIGHILLVNFTHVSDWTLTPYFERMYMPLIAIVFLPFLYDFFTQLALRNMAGTILVCLVVLWRIGRFVDVGLEYKDRTALAEKAIAQAHALPGSKFELHPNDYKWCMNFVDWSFTMESMLRSSAMDKGHTVTICTWEDLEEGKNNRRLHEKTFMMRRWEVMPDSYVNPEYFHIRNGTYVQLKEMCK